jgi:hypothetical protein
MIVPPLSPHATVTMYATQYSEIPSAFAKNDRVRNRALLLIAREAVPGKATEGGTRLDDLRSVLTRIVNGEISPSSAYAEIERVLSRQQSVHSSSNRVFATGWGERLIRTQVSRFYNQAFLEIALDDGVKMVFVPHSSEEDGASLCTQVLAGNSHDCHELLSRLVKTYSEGDFTSKDPKIPHHPHCTHVVTPS